MPKAEKSKNTVQNMRRRPGMSPEARENQLISLAVNLAEKQLMNGTASAQVITHYLKLATTRERIEKEILERQRDLIQAKTESYKEAKRFDQLLEDAMDAMKRYQGGPADDETDD